MSDDETAMDKIIRLEEENDALRSKANDDTLLAKVFANPLVRDVLDAEQRGEEIEIVRKGAHKKVEMEKTPETIVAAPDLNSMDNAELTSYLTNHMGQAVKSIVEGSLSPMMEKVSALEKNALSVAQERVDKQIEDAKKLHKDFGAMMPAMERLNKVTAGLGVEQLYVLAKAESGGSAKPDETTASEKPTHENARGGGAGEPEPKVHTGPQSRRGFDSLVADSLAKQDFSALE